MNWDIPSAWDIATIIDALCTFPTALQILT
jgi:hypothetical protein